MYIGIIDADALQFPNDFFPNLDVMKTASYHWGKGDYVELVLDFDSPIMAFDEVYFFKTKLDGDFHSRYALDKKCHYYNSALYGGTHLPLNEEIEKSEPNIDIYKKYFSKIYNINKEREKNIAKWKKAKFLRFITNETFMDNSQYIGENKNRANIYIYDEDNLFKSSYALEILNILQQTTNVTFLNNQKINDLELLSKVNSGTYLSAKNQFIYNGTVDSKIIKELCKISDKFKRLVRIEIGYDEKYQNHTEIYLTSLFRQILNWCIYICIYGNKLNFIINPKIPENSIKTLIGMASFWIKFSPDGSNFYEHVENTGKQKTFTTLIQLMKYDDEIKRLSNIRPFNIKLAKGVWLL